MMTTEARNKHALNGNWDLAMDYPVLDPAADLDVGENHAFWFFDHAGQYSLLNCHIQGGGSVPAGSVITGTYQKFDNWRRRRIVFPIGGPNDELMVDFAIADGAEANGYALGGWTFRCIVPFERWTGQYRGSPRVIPRLDSLPGIVDLDGPREPIEIDVDFEMALPPWLTGGYCEDPPGRADGLLAVGRPRYEQLCHVLGTVRRPGRADYQFTGTGLRTHRLGARAATVCRGTSWASAVFPSGKGFGSLQLLDKAGGKMYAEAFVAAADRVMRQVRVVRTPYLEKLDCVGRRFEIELEEVGRSHVVAGEVLQCAFNYGIGVDRAPGAIDFAHMMCRYHWDDEETVGLLEQGMEIERLT